MNEYFLPNFENINSNVNISNADFIQLAQLFLGILFISVEQATFLWRGDRNFSRLSIALLPTYKIDKENVKHLGDFIRPLYDHIISSRDASFKTLEKFPDISNGKFMKLSRLFPELEYFLKFKKQAAKLRSILIQLVYILMMLSLLLQMDLWMHHVIFSESDFICFGTPSKIDDSLLYKAFREVEFEIKYTDDFNSIDEEERLQTISIFLSKMQKYLLKYNRRLIETLQLKLKTSATKYEEFRAKFFSARLSEHADSSDTKLSPEDNLQFEYEFAVNKPISKYAKLLLSMSSFAVEMIEKSLKNNKWDLESLEILRFSQYIPYIMGEFILGCSGIKDLPYIHTTPLKVETNSKSVFENDKVNVHLLKIVANELEVIQGAIVTTFDIILVELTKHQDTLSSLINECCLHNSFPDEINSIYFSLVSYDMEDMNEFHRRLTSLSADNSYIIQLKNYVKDINLSHIYTKIQKLNLKYGLSNEFFERIFRFGVKPNIWMLQEKTTFYVKDLITQLSDVRDKIILLNGGEFYEIELDWIPVLDKSLQPQMFTKLNGLGLESPLYGRLSELFHPNALDTEKLSSLFLQFKNDCDNVDSHELKKFCDHLSDAYDITNSGIIYSISSDDIIFYDELSRSLQIVLDNSVMQGVFLKKSLLKDIITIEAYIERRYSESVENSNCSKVLQVNLGSVELYILYIKSVKDSLEESFWPNEFMPLFLKHGPSIRWHLIALNKRLEEGENITQELLYFIGLVEKSRNINSSSGFGGNSNDQSRAIPMHPSMSKYEIQLRKSNLHSIIYPELEGFNEFKIAGTSCTNLPLIDLERKYSTKSVYERVAKENSDYSKSIAARISNDYKYAIIPSIYEEIKIALYFPIYSFMAHLRLDDLKTHSVANILIDINLLEEEFDGSNVKKTLESIVSSIRQKLIPLNCFNICTELERLARALLPNASAFFWDNCKVLSISTLAYLEKLEKIRFFIYNNMLDFKSTQVEIGPKRIWIKHQQSSSLEKIPYKQVPLGPFDITDKVNRLQMERDVAARTGNLDFYSQEYPWYNYAIFTILVLLYSSGEIYKIIQEVFFSVPITNFFENEGQSSMENIPTSGQSGQLPLIPSYN